LMSMPVVCTCTRDNSCPLSQTRNLILIKLLYTYLVVECEALAPCQAALSQLHNLYLNHHLIHPPIHQLNLLLNHLLNLYLCPQCSHPSNHCMMISIIDIQ
jgi:hypothetical protein